MIGKSGAESRGQYWKKYSFVNRTIQLWNQLCVDAVNQVILGKVKGK
jgi:hypothetical protein